jgi:histidinol-phosphate/aromatic aminotransferase/cobyric acid decarboxylase-like protein/adenosyl cobinamide kinase/adenosyl cobinamide phosphate guanylyltransferase
MSLTLVMGGTRSGKSSHAERLALGTGLPVRYLASADGADPAMAERIAAHRARRPAGWEVRELEDALAPALGERAGRCVLLDGLGAWIAGVLHRAGAFAGADPSDAGAHVAAQVQELLLAARREPEPVIVVAEHAGEGVLPADAGSRLWLDLLGEAVQRLSAAAERVELIVAGRPVPLGRPACAEGPTAACASTPTLRAHGDLEVRAGDADHAVNVMAGGPPEWLRSALHEALEERACRYPDEREACAALALAHGRHPDEVVPTNGAAEALWLLPGALRPRLAACVHPAFTESEAALRAHGVPVVRVLRRSEQDFALDPRAVPEQADLVIVGNPASPCGTLTPAAGLLALRRPGRTLVVDEAFMDMVPGESATLAGEPLDEVIVVRSLTKALAIPGVRAGYALASPRLAERLRAVRPAWSVNALALAALRAAAARPDALAEAASRAQREREDLAGRLVAIAEVRVWPGAANFCLVEVPNGPEVLAALRARGIAVRAAASFPGLGPGYLRVTARDPSANERLATALAEAVSACG